MINGKPILYIGIILITFTACNGKRKSAEPENLICDQPANPPMEYNADHPAYVKLQEAFFLLQEENYTAAADSYTVAILIDTTRVEGFYGRGYCMTNLKQPTLAILDFNKAIEVDSTYRNLFANRADAKMDLNDLEGAIEDYTKAIARSPQNPVYYVNRGICYHDLGKQAEACEDWSKVCGAIREERGINIHYNDCLRAK